jgi:hypothetical protein
MRVRSGIYIERPPAEVFDFVADHSNDMLWRSELASHEYVGDLRRGVGARMHQRLAYQGRTAEISLEETDHVEGERICFRAHGGVRAHGCYDIVADGPGTLFRVAITVELKGAESMLERYLQQALEGAVASDLERLKAVLESRSAGIRS